MIEVDLKKKKETKGTVVYEAPDTVCPSVYLRKTELKKMFTNYPEEIRITISNIMK